jgi:YVTN family beta-propeller protein
MVKRFWVGLGLLAFIGASLTTATMPVSPAYAAENDVIATATVGPYPYGVAVTPDGDHVYVSNAGENTVSVIQTSDNTVVGSRITVGNEPTGVAVTPDGDHVYVSNRWDDTVSVIRTSDNTVVGAAIPVGRLPLAIAVTPDGAHVYVANSSRITPWKGPPFSDFTLSVIRTSDNTVIATVTVGDDPTGVTVTPDGDHVYVSNAGENTVSVIQTSDNTVIDTVTVGDEPKGVTVTPDGDHVYVANSGDDTVSVIQTSNNTVVGTPIVVGNAPTGVAVNSAGTRVYVANYGSAPNTVSVIQTSDNTVIATVTVGTPPIGVAVNPTGPGVYVTGYDDPGIVSVIEGVSTSTSTSTSTTNSASSDTPGIFLAVNGVLVGEQVEGSPVYYGTDRVAVTSTYVLTVTAVSNVSPSLVTLAEGTIGADGCFSSMVRLPNLAPGTYNVRMTGEHTNGATLELTSQVTIDAGVFTSIGANIPVIR